MDELDQFLIGRALIDGWTVAQPHLVQRDAATACRSYVARHADGRVAFVKVLDPRADGSLEQAQRRLAQFIYESHITEICGSRNMRRVIRGLAKGVLNTPPPFSLPLHYLIFEWAERDVRSHAEPYEPRHMAMILRWMHHTATAIAELHYSEIVHQDIRPANVVVMPDLSAKLGGLSRAYDQRAPRDSQPQDGDPTYLAPEHLYGEPLRTLEDRFAADMYAFGGSVFFLLRGLSVNAQLSRLLDPMHHWTRWRGSFADVLPYVTAAMDEVLHPAIADLGPLIAARLGPALRQLCDPNPAHRGHPANHQGHGSRFAMERYVSLFNLLATHAEVELRRAG
jgi:serine/threonine protein kinase